MLKSMGFTAPQLSNTTQGATSYCPDRATSQEDVTSAYQTAPDIHSVCTAASSTQDV